MKRYNAVMQICSDYDICSGCPFKNENNRYNVNDTYLCTAYRSVGDHDEFTYTDIIDSILLSLGYSIDEHIEYIPVSEDDIMSLFSE